VRQTVAFLLQTGSEVFVVFDCGDKLFNGVEKLFGQVSDVHVLRLSRFRAKRRGPFPDEGGDLNGKKCPMYRTQSKCRTHSRVVSRLSEASKTKRPRHCCVRMRAKSGR